MKDSKDIHVPPLTTPQAAEYLNLRSSTLEVWRVTGRGPIFCRLGSRAIRYRQDDLDEFIEAGRRDSTSTADAARVIPESTTDQADSRNGK